MGRAQAPFARATRWFLGPGRSGRPFARFARRCVSFSSWVALSSAAGPVCGRSCAARGGV
eukprot:8726335-Lingulodinium_polyedra.AAC.1